MLATCAVRGELMLLQPNRQQPPRQASRPEGRPPQSSRGKLFFAAGLVCLLCGAPWSSTTAGTGESEATGPRNGAEPSAALLPRSEPGTTATRSPPHPAEPDPGAGSPAPREGTSDKPAESAPPEAAGPAVESVDVLRALERRGLQTFVKALQAAGLDRTLQGPGPYTLFAPTETAWKRMSSEKMAALFSDRSRLRAILATHILKGRVLGKSVVILKNALMMSGAIVPIDGSHGLHQTRISGATVVGPDVICKNGVVHLIDGVMQLPERKSKALSEKAALSAPQGDEAATSPVATGKADAAPRRSAKKAASGQKVGDVGRVDRAGGASSSGPG